MYPLENVCPNHPPIRLRGSHLLPKQEPGPLRTAFPGLVKERAQSRHAARLRQRSRIVLPEQRPRLRSYPPVPSQALVLLEPLTGVKVLELYLAGRSRLLCRLRGLAERLPSLVCPPPTPLVAPSLVYRSARMRAGTKASGGTENQVFSPAPHGQRPGPP